MRIDKFLKNSRIIKRRTVAKTACETGRVKVNSQIAKPGNDVNIGDIVEVAFGDKAIKVKVLELIENTSKLSAEKMFKVIED